MEFQRELFSELSLLMRCARTFPVQTPSFFFLYCLMQRVMIDVVFWFDKVSYNLKIHLKEKKVFVLQSSIQLQTCITFVAADKRP